MAYIYEVSFDIDSDQLDELRIGASLERVIGYLRTLLPSEQGFITARAMYSLNESSMIRLIVESIWDQWEDLLVHKSSGLAEQKVLAEFHPQVDIGNLTVRVYKEVQ